MNLTWGQGPSGMIGSAGLRPERLERVDLALAEAASEIGREVAVRESVGVAGREEWEESGDRPAARVGVGDDRNGSAN
jgi:hypothetical protein